MYEMKRLGRDAAELTVLAQHATREAYPEAVGQAHAGFAVASGEQGRQEDRRACRQAGVPSGGCSSTRGLYSTSWMRPSKVR